MALQGPFVVVADSPAADVVEALHAAGAFPIIETNWADAAAAMASVEPEAVVLAEQASWLFRAAPYLVFAANVFALMGLRQLYFLLGGLLKRLVYLPQGLAVILCFIGLKLLLHALHENKLPFINGGGYVDVPEIPTLASLGVIVLTLIVTTVASLMKTRAGSSPRH